MKVKPVVKYEDTKFEFCGETHQIKKKLSRIAVLKGESAKAVNRARGFRMAYDSTKGKEKLEFYKEETISDVLVEGKAPIETK